MLSMVRMLRTAEQRDRRPGSLIPSLSFWIYSPCLRASGSRKQDISLIPDSGEGGITLALGKVLIEDCYFLHFTDEETEA